MEQPTPKRPTPTLPDLLALTGTGLLGYGLWMFSPSLSLCVLGVLLLAAGIFGQINAKREVGP